MASMTSKIFSKLFWWRTPEPPENKIVEVLTPFESFIIGFQKIIIWENRLASSLCVVAVNILFWFLLCYEYQFYGFLFTALLTLVLTMFWVDQVSVPSHERQTRDWTSDFYFTGHGSDENASKTRVLTVPELGRHISQVQQISRDLLFRVRHIRQEQPGLFCIGASFTCVLVSIIGRSVSGWVLIYSIIMLILVVPGLLIRYLPCDIWNQIASTFTSQTENNDVYEDLLPETNNEALEVLKLAGEVKLPDDSEEEDESHLLLSARTNDTAESSLSKHSSFCPEIVMMPSHENSLDCFEVEFDLPTQSQLASARDRRSDSEDSEREIADITFKTGHFKDSSEEEEEKFTKGLKFTEIDGSSIPKEPIESQSLASTVGRNIMSVGVSILSTVYTQKPTEQPTPAPVVIKPKKLEKKDSDSDSFELISEDEYDAS